MCEVRRAFRVPSCTCGESKQCLTMRERCTVVHLFFSIARATEAVPAMLFRQLVMLDAHKALSQFHVWSSSYLQSNALQIRRLTLSMRLPHV